MAKDIQNVLDAVPVSRDPFKLAYHIMPPKNWMNDPNGLVHWNGEYHIFYQHHPHGVTWGPMHWGHVKSTDLVHWKHEPIALTPGEIYDADGCFSGSAVDDNGKLTLIYTGHVFIDQEKDLVEQVQCIATSEDGKVFTKYPGNPVISAPPSEGSGHFRDPKVWKHGESWYMVLGTRKGDIGKVVLYKSKDLHNWEYVGVMLESNGLQGYMWECPDLIEIGGRHVLIMSPQGMEPVGDRYQNRFQTVYLTGDLDYSTGRFTYDTFEELDKGFDFYAAQTMKDKHGRYILFGWMDMWDSQMPTQQHGWSGALTIPRELLLTHDGRLAMQPVEELKKLRGRHSHKENLLLDETQSILPVANGAALELLVSLKLDGTAQKAGLLVRCSEDFRQQTRIYIDQNEQKLVVDTTASGEGPGGIRMTPLNTKGQEELILHLFLDRSSVEIFTEDGLTVLSNRIYPEETSLGVSVFAEGGTAAISTVDVWELEDIWE
ncbi:sucrose-6-phosphate hydrolase [Bacillus mangrovi]|uniref:Sucrose-6-phosphate hydrolase n=1 Tax=Metabacillus mangrovi TaxID=1491830 RepID=A0A7X2S7Y5_9BACI|nr:glycoside hydrolase family 32 protein [Metabacillus mangrovi]MTH54940.1 sucrose-6-phosphate hydrolase [Metabacillus mangrovi]